MTDLSTPAEEPNWSGWGDPGRVPTLPEPVLGLLRQALGVTPVAIRPLAMADVTVPQPRLAPSVVDELGAAVGTDHVHSELEARIRHTRGKSSPDLVLIRRGDGSAAPDAVVLPATHDEVLAVLRTAAEHRVAVVPFGGGTSVVGGLSPQAAAYAGTIALDLRRLDQLLWLDEVSRTAELQAGLRGPAVEQLLGTRGYTLGHFPQSFEYASVGGFAATRSSGQASLGYGRFDDMVVGLTAATPEGTLQLGRAPASAAGPDLRQLLLGSEGALGVITSVTVAVQPQPEARCYEGWRFRSFAEGLGAVRRLAQDGPRPTVLRLSDEAETAVGLARPASIGAGADSGCLLIVGCEGAAAEVDDRRNTIAQVLTDCAGQPLGPEPGKAWAGQRYAGPYLRDALLDVGVFVETLETAAFWSRLPAVYDAVRGALTESLAAEEAAGLVLCHVSHAYPTGASLYFTLACNPGNDPLARWHAAKTAASDAILRAGATISHHHGVGTDHLRHYAEEIRPLGLGVVRAAKSRLDPTGVLNPGVLVGTMPDQPSSSA